MVGAGGSRHTISRRGARLTSCINGMRIAGLSLAVAICCGATPAGAQLRAFVNVGGPGNAPAPGSAGLGTSGLGLGGFGSATESLGGPGLGDAGIGSSPGLSFPLLDQGAGNALGVTGNATGTAQGSLSSAIDRPSSPIELRDQFADGFRQERRLPANGYGDETGRQAKAERHCRGHFIEWPRRGHGIQGQSRQKSLNRFGASAV